MEAGGLGAECMLPDLSPHHTASGGCRGHGAQLAAGRHRGRRAGAHRQVRIQEHPLTGRMWGVRARDPALSRRMFFHGAHLPGPHPGAPQCGGGGEALGEALMKAAEAWSSPRTTRGGHARLPAGTQQALPPPTMHTIRPAVNTGYLITWGSLSARLARQGPVLTQCSGQCRLASPEDANEKLATGRWPTCPCPRGAQRRGVPHTRAWDLLPHSYHQAHQPAPVPSTALSCSRPNADTGRANRAGSRPPLSSQDLASVASLKLTVSEKPYWPPSARPLQCGSPCPGPTFWACTVGTRTHTHTHPLWTCATGAWVIRTQRQACWTALGLL